MAAIRQVKISTLLQTAGGVLIIGSTALYLLQKSKQRKVRALPHYIESLRIVSEHDRAKEALGPPIEVGNVDFADRRSNYIDRTTSKLKIPVSGKIDAGFMEVRAVRQSESSPFSTAMIKLHLDEGVVTIYDNATWHEESASSHKT